MVHVSLLFLRKLLSALKSLSESESVCLFGVFAALVLSFGLIAVFSAFVVFSTSVDLVVVFAACVDLTVVFCSFLSFVLLLSRPSLPTDVCHLGRVVCRKLVQFSICLVLLPVDSVNLRIVLVNNRIVFGFLINFNEKVFLLR